MAVQMTCPYCKREFPYDNGWIDYKISSKGQRITEINRSLSEIKALGAKKDGYTRKRRAALVKELNDLKVEMAQLKSIRKACDQQIKFHEYQFFKDRVKERFGEAEYRKILDAVQEDLKAYSISSLMKREYTRSPGKGNVISINKL